MCSWNDKMTQQNQLCCNKLNESIYILFLKLLFAITKPEVDTVKYEKNCVIYVTDSDACYNNQDSNTN